MLLWCAEDSDIRAKPVPGTPDKGEMKVVPVLLSQLDGISSVRIFIPKDLRASAARAGVRSSVLEVQRRFNGSLPLLDPVEDMHIRSESFTATVAKVLSLQERLEKNAFHAAADKETRYRAFQRKVIVNRLSVCLAAVFVCVCVLCAVCVWCYRCCLVALRAA